MAQLRRRVEYATTAAAAAAAAAAAEKQKAVTMVEARKMYGSASSL